KQAQALRAEYNRQATELKFLQDSLNDTTQDYKEFTKAQQIANSGWTKAGNGMTSISKGLDSVSNKLSSTGKSLTNSITKPALIAGGALAGMTAKLGFDRLVGLDSAKAKLEGLGKSTEEVERISKQVANGIKGGMTTMAEGTDVAAVALASGVKEGKELEKYIKLVGDASVGANRPVADMAMIFNRVTGQGKLLTEELNMVEDGMPGFSKAMAKHLGVTYEEFRKMVTEGQVSSKDFMTVMEDFAGNMSGAYAKSFKGMWQNSKAYIGMIGESLLSGAFEQSKDSLREFEKLLQSPGAQQWAKETGEKLATGIEKISSAISGIISWFNSLDKGTQKSIASIMKWSTLILIGIGPVLTIFGKLTGVLAGTFGGLGKVLGFMGKLSVESKNAGSMLGGFTKMFPKLGGAIGLVANPIGLTVLAIGALVAGLVIAYKKSETFRNIVNGAFNAIVTGLSALWNGIKTFLQPVIKAITDFGGELKKTIGDFWAENGAQFMQALTNIKNGFMSLWTTSKPAISAIGTAFSAVFGVIKNVVVAVMPIITGILKVGWTLIQALIVSVWNNIKGVITGALNVIMGVIKVFSGIFTGDFKLMWEGVKQIFAGAFQFLWNLVQLWFVGKIFGIFKLGFGLIKGIVSSSLGGVRGTFTVVLKAIWGFVKSIFTNIWTFIKFIFGNVLKFTKAVWTMIKLAVTNPVKLILILVRATFTTLSKVVRAIFTGLSKVVKAIWTGLKNAVVKTAKLLYTLVRNNFQLLRKAVSTIVSALSKAVRATFTFLKNAVVKTIQVLSSTVRAVFSTMSKVLRAIASGLSKAVRATFNALKNAVIKTIKLLYTTLRAVFNTLRKVVTGIVRGLKDAVTGNFRGLKDNAIKLITKTKDGIVNGFKGMYNAGKSWIGKLKNFIGDSVSGFKKVASKVGKGVANGAIAGLNGMIDGINSLSDKIMKKKLIKKKIPKLSTGTGLSPQVKTDSNGLLKRGTKAIVNDKGLGNARGANGHKELIYRKGGKIERPIGNNKKVSLKRGDGVINGAQSKSLLPHFAKGTNVAEELWNGVKDTTSKGYHKAKDKGSDIIEGGKDLAGKAKKQFDKTIGDVMDYVKNPMKLVDKTMKLFGVDFSGVKGAMGGMMNFGYKGLKSSLKDLITDWFAESEGGDGSSSWLPWKNILQTFGHYTGGLMFNGGRHYGIDFGMPTGTPIKALTSGKISQAGWVNGGGGNQVTLDEPGGKWFQWYMHMRNGGVKVKKGQKVQAGDILGYSGNTGNSTTPHLHIQRMKGYPSNATAVDPMSWLKSLKGGGSKSASKWKPEVIKALKMNGLPTTSAYVNAWIKQIDTESSGNAGAMGGDDGLADGRAQGLVQVKPGTFRANKFKGHGNIMNGLDNLLAGIRYAKGRYGVKGMLGVIGHGHGYATGGVIRENGLYNLTEQGHEEIVIPTDPRRSSDAMKLMAYASEKIQGKGKKNKRPNQLSNGNTQVTPNDNTEILALMAQQLQAQKEQIDLLTQIALSNAGIEAKAGFSEKDVSRAQGNRARMKQFNLGM
ncbi:peptidoglycan DD-metalloendopeptidase family protein, partial [Mammaliicoccus sciuri]|uniref:peptidoglycan DD-metalloendopeptidase family protein n=1 Tax=Mammaliicoccus sciuri TaxID=1296 RepID=UPI0019511B0A